MFLNIRDFFSRLSLLWVLITYRNDTRKRSGAELIRELTSLKEKWLNCEYFNVTTSFDTSSHLNHSSFHFQLTKVTIYLAICLQIGSIWTYLNNFLCVSLLLQNITNRCIIFTKHRHSTQPEILIKAYFLWIGIGKPCKFCCFCFRIWLLLWKCW